MKQKRKYRLDYTVGETTQEFYRGESVIELKKATSLLVEECSTKKEPCQITVYINHPNV